MSPGFMDALNRLADISLPIKVAQKVLDIRIACLAAIEVYEIERFKLIDELATKDGDKVEVEANGNAKFSEENLKIFAEKMNKLMTHEVHLEKLTLDELSNVNMSANELETLMPIIHLS